ncbi:hypothetical protein KNP414_02378 [Paenibacillus mucilaginosus KNP414]|uniref:Uncharacterized protein n=1 Tax=Paenibacillus mucilaginosus (strain KNP414) TaxID=1036673 RepID=F8F5C8_PAEMK|nr:hypothetical protein KNP414_02378 [Paenibacillus mucilaginosus KNP414]
MSEASGSEHGFSVFAGLPRADWPLEDGFSVLQRLRSADSRRILAPKTDFPC